MRASFLVTIVLLLLAVTLLLMNVTGSNVSGAEQLIWYGLLFGFVLGAAWLAVCDPHAFAGFIAIMSMAAGSVLLMMATISSLSPVTVFLGGSLCMLGFAGGIGFVAWTRLSKDPIPDLLHTRFAPGAVFEKKGVQFVVGAPSTLTRDAIAPIEVVLQNCTSALRRIDLELGDASLWPGKPALIYRAPDTIELGPSEVKRVLFPACASANARDSARTYLRMRVSGDRARRTRRRRAQPHVTPPGLLQILVVSLLLLPLGVALIVIDRGGILMRIVPTGRLRERSEMPEPSVETLWGPAHVADAA